MQFLKNISPRERVILIITVGLFSCVAIYVGFLEDMVRDYRDLSESLGNARTLYLAQKNLLKEGERIDREYEEFAGALTQEQEGKRPEAVFTQEIATLCRSLEVQMPDIDKRQDRKVPGAPGFSYLILPIKSPITMSVEKAYDFLVGLQNRNFMILSLLIDRAGSSVGDVNVTLDVAQIVRDEEIGGKAGTKR